MLGRSAAAVAFVLLAACGTVESAGRNAGRDAQPNAQAPMPLPPPRPTPAQSEPGEVASGVTLDTPRPQPQRERTGGDIVVPGQVERQVPTPDDPRSTAERMADIRAWDRCVMEAQGQASGDPMRPQLETPEEVCREELGMTGRLAVPISRRR